MRPVTSTLPGAKVSGRMVTRIEQSRSTNERAATNTIRVSPKFRAIVLPSHILAAFGRLGELEMTKRNQPSVRHARVARPEHHPLMTAAEARGEAAYLVMCLLAKRLPRGMCKGLMMESYVAANQIDIPAITEEVESIFWGIEFEPPTR